MNVKTMSAADAKTRFGQFIDSAQREPVMITKKDRPVGVFFSIDDLENTVWGEEVKKADAEGYLSEKDSMDRLNRILNA